MLFFVLFDVYEFKVKDGMLYLGKVKLRGGVK